MIVYKVRRKKDGLYLSAARRRSDRVWTDLYSSKTYSNIGHAKNAIHNQNESIRYHKKKPEKFEILSFQVEYTLIGIINE